MIKLPVKASVHLVGASWKLKAKDVVLIELFLASRSQDALISSGDRSYVRTVRQAEEQEVLFTATPTHLEI